MRIKALTLENITSLKGLHKIDFDKIAELSDLFAITGPTGSGKSSILTAISMALYGDHPKGLNASDIITTGVAKGEIHLTFTKDQDTFEVAWSCQVLKKDGTPRKTALTSRTISKNGRPIEEDAKDILGLDYDQFSKVVILNQGKFSDFLNSSFTQRKDLLEGLFNQHGLKALSPLIRRKIKDIELEISNFEKQGELTLLMEPDEVKGVQDELHNNKTTFEDFTYKRDRLKEIFRVLKETQSLSEKNIQNEKNLSKDKATIEILIKELNDIRSLQKEWRNKEDSFELKKKDLIPLISRAKSLLEKSLTLKESQSKLIQSQSNQVAREKVVNEEIKVSENLVKESRKKIESLKVEIQIRLEDLNKEDIQNQFNNAKKEKINLKESLSKSNFLQDQLKSIEEEAKKEKDSIHKDILELLANDALMDSELIAVLKSMSSAEPTSLTDNIIKAREICLTLKERNEQFKELQREAQKNKDRLIEKQNDLKKREDDLNRTKEEVRVNLDKKKSEQIALKDLENGQKEKESLLEGHNYLTEAYRLIKASSDDSCPVCEQQIKEKRILEIEAFLKNQDTEKIQKELNTILSQIKGITQSLSSIETTLRFLKEREDNHSNEIQIIKKDIEDLNKNIKQFEIHLKEETSLSTEFVNKVSDLLIKWENKAIRLNAQRKNWKETKDKIAAEEKNYKKHGEALNQTLGPLRQYFNEISIENLDDQYHHFHQQLSKINEFELLEGDLSGQEKLIERGKRNLQEIQNQLKAIREELKDIDKELMAIENEFQIKELPTSPEKLEDELSLEEKLLKEKLDSLSKEILEKEISYEKKNAQIGLLKEQKDRSLELLTRYRANLKDLQDEINCWTPYPWALGPHFLENQNPSTYWVAFLPRLRKVLMSDWEDETEVSSLALFIQELIGPFELDITQKYKDLEKAIIVLETQLSENQKQEEKLSGLKEKISFLRKKKDTYDKLGPFLLKDAFRDFALEVLEEALLQLANHEISSLAEGRYELVHGKAGKRSELLVKDKWQGHTLRKVSTLSGGETFLLSLGLALGLSEMTRGQTDVESFFIDEGFGTLDQESIAQVLDCLMQMQSRGKQIGLISHVKELTDQIPVKLELEKNNFGESRIQLR